MLWLTFQLRIPARTDPMLPNTPPPQQPHPRLFPLLMGYLWSYGGAAGGTECPASRSFRLAWRAWEDAGFCLFTPLLHAESMGFNMPQAGITLQLSGGVHTPPLQPSVH